MLIKPECALYVQPLDLAAGPKDRLHFDYEYANIFAIPYDLDHLPLDVVLTEDYKYLLGIYRELVDNPLLPGMEQLLESQIRRLRTLCRLSLKSSHLAPLNSNVAKPAVLAVHEYLENRRKSEIAASKSCTTMEIAKISGFGQSAADVIWHARDGEITGWDISSLDESGQPVQIEVKASVGSSVTSLIMTANEWRAAREHGAGYFLYLVTDVFKKQPRIEVICDPAKRVQEGALRVETASLMIGLIPYETKSASSAK